MGFLARIAEFNIEKNGEILKLISQKLLLDILFICGFHLLIFLKWSVRDCKRFYIMYMVSLKRINTVIPRDISAPTDNLHLKIRSLKQGKKFYFPTLFNTYPYFIVSKVQNHGTKSRMTRKWRQQIQRPLTFCSAFKSTHQHKYGSCSCYSTYLLSIMT